MQRYMNRFVTQHTRHAEWQTRWCSALHAQYALRKALLPGRQTEWFTAGEHAPAWPSPDEAIHEPLRPIGQGGQAQSAKPTIVIGFPDLLCRFVGFLDFANDALRLFITRGPT